MNFLFKRSSRLGCLYTPYTRTWHWKIRMFNRKYSWKLTYPLKIDGWKMKFLFQNGSFSWDKLVHLRAGTSSVGTLQLSHMISCDGKSHGKPIIYPPWKLTWLAGKSTLNMWIFHCHVSFEGCRWFQIVFFFRYFQAKAWDDDPIWPWINGKEGPGRWV